ncbi:MAG: hypothetical protein JWQ66_1258 [Mucilaginibacter sp.]|nr:hypothetical protein [Mucilaginibacter sp.]
MEPVGRSVIFYKQVTPTELIAFVKIYLST